MILYLRTFSVLWLCVIRALAWIHVFVSKLVKSFRSHLAEGSGKNFGRTMQNGDKQQLKKPANTESDMWKTESQPSCKVTGGLCGRLKESLDKCMLISAISHD